MFMVFPNKNCFVASTLDTSMLYSKSKLSFDVSQMISRFWHKWHSSANWKWHLNHDICPSLEFLGDRDLSLKTDFGNK